MNIMKKLFNKALLYQYYMLGRWPMMLGGFIFALVSYFGVKEELSNVKYGIAGFHWNTMHYVNLIVLLVSWFVLAAVYFFITGINKKNSMIFLQSGPFTKEQIKINQIFILFASLVIMVLAYIYAFLCLAYKNQELISFVPNFYRVFTRDIMRITLCGMAFISYLVFMDMVFSNIIIEILMIPICPLLVVFTLSAFNDIYYTVFGKSIYLSSIFDKLGDLVSCIYYYVAYNSHIGGYYEAPEFLSTKETMFLILILTCLLFAASWFLNEKYKMNNVNKIFNFRPIQVAFEYLISLDIILFIEIIVVEMYGFKYFEYRTTSVLMVYFAVITFIAILGAWIVCKLFDKFIKKYL